MKASTARKRFLRNIRLGAAGNRNNFRVAANRA